MSDSQKKRAVVTGVSSGIGRAVAKELVAEGWAVLGVARRGEQLQSLADETNGAVVPLVLDITRDDASEQIIAACEAQWGGIDLLVNNAGMSYVSTFDEMPTSKIDEILDLNVRALMKLSLAIIPVLKKSSCGQIINVASIAAHMPMQTIAVYCASKAAVVTFSRVLAKELGPAGIRVNVLSPTGTNTEIFEKAGVDLDASQFVPAEDQAKVLVSLTRLPEGLDVCETITDQRFNPVVL